MSALIKVLAYPATVVALLMPVDPPAPQPPAPVAQADQVVPELSRRTEPPCRCGPR
ncbi:hypothetical protein [Microlunatus parietis]|uniref:Uncharacterized protein n=1 Tax=Microlunatus parietis TaxID=682979 RepID=A0A7Y9L9N7_9ACTN|nr:hypothetical protein [Microlunatus parietis]NYE68760.1 hypothetical protein [Microlunatus parietis]